MSISLRCEQPGCRKSLKVKVELAGKRIKCPGCGERLQVPNSAALTTSPAAPRNAPPRRPPPVALPFSAPSPPIPSPSRAAKPRSTMPRATMPRDSHHRPPDTGFPVVWVGCLVLLAFCAGFVVFAFFRMADLEESVGNQAEVRQAFDEMHKHFDGAQRFHQVRQQAFERVAPSLRFWRLMIPVGILSGMVVLIGELIAFTFMLGKRDLRRVLRWYVGSVASVAVCAVLAGLALLYAVMTKDSNADFREVQMARDELRRDMPGAADRLAEAERRHQERTQSSDRRLKTAFCLFVAAIAIGVHAILAQALGFCVLVYKLWAQVQDGGTPITPGKALGFLFIPFYNFYWAFVALPGLATELNRCAYQRSLAVQPASFGLMVTYCVLCFAALIPFLGIVAVVVNLGIAVAAFRSAARVGIALQESSGGY